MTEIPTEPVSAQEQADFEVMHADTVITGRAMFLAGVLVAAEADTLSRPQQLPTDVWADQDPQLVMEIWERACAVIWRTAQLAAAPWLYRDRLESVRGQLALVGYEAMARSVQRSLRVVVPGSGVHPADGESGRGH